MKHRSSIVTENAAVKHRVQRNAWQVKRSSNDNMQEIAWTHETKHIASDWLDIGIYYNTKAPYLHKKINYGISFIKKSPNKHTHYLSFWLFYNVYSAVPLLNILFYLLHRNWIFITKWNKKRRQLIMDADFHTKTRYSKNGLKYINWLKIQ